MTRGFTLIEVVMALIVLELAVLGALGTSTLASRTWHRAEQVERDVARFASVFDSLRGLDSIRSDSVTYTGGTAWWRMTGDGSLVVEVTSSEASLGVEMRRVRR